MLLFLSKQFCALCFKKNLLILITPDSLVTCFYIIGNTIQSIVDNNKVELLTIVFIKTLKTKNQKYVKNRRSL